MANDAFVNCYADERRAEAYATLDFARTYHLAFRDLPAIFRRHVRASAALDFGCGTGRSTRFLRECGFDAIGIDVSPQMIAKANAIDPGGDYRLIDAADFAQSCGASFDLVLSAFTFDNVATLKRKATLFRSLAAVLNTDGAIVSVVSSPAIYVHEWASFSTRAFPENQTARTDDLVKIITTDYPDSRPVEDILCTDDSYREVFERAGLGVEAMYEPLATGDEPYDWVNETRIAPWVIYVLRKII